MKINNEIKQETENVYEEIFNYILELAYTLYQNEWCEQHGYPYGEVMDAYTKGQQYNGEMFVSIDEFADNEFAEGEYIEHNLFEDNKDLCKLYRLCFSSWDEDEFNREIREEYDKH